MEYIYDSPRHVRHHTAKYVQQCYSEPAMGRTACKLSARSLFHSFKVKSYIIVYPTYMCSLYEAIKSLPETNDF